MDPLNLPQIILLFVLGQGLFLGSILFTLRKGGRIANRLLAVAVLLMTYFTFVFFLNDSGYRYYFPYLLINGYSITPLIPVVFYFYFKTLTEGSVGKLYYLHFIPFILQFLYWLPNNTSGLFHTLSEEAFEVYYSTTIVRSVSACHMIIFGIYAYLLYSRIDLNDQTEHLKKLKWLRQVRFHYLLLAAIFTAGTLSLWVVDTNTIRYVFFFFLSFFIYLIGYKGYAQSDTLFHIRDLKPKYYHSKLTKRQSKEIYQHLLSLMRTEKFYLNPNIKLAEVAEMVNTSPHHLSRVINENYGDNFLDFMNKYRIEEAKNILSDKKKESFKMLAVALDAGFGNKVSFYKNFKKFTGNLPTEFRNQQA